jgi:hypothetical protein
MHELYEWTQSLNEARTDDVVLANIHEFLSKLTPDQLMALPDECRPPRIGNAAQVSDYAYTLVRRDCEAPPDAVRDLHLIASFFALASQRLAQISRFRVPVRE